MEMMLLCNVVEWRRWYVVVSIIDEGERDGFLLFFLFWFLSSPFFCAKNYVYIRLELELSVD
jgi:hypothetical protein